MPVISLDRCLCVHSMSQVVDITVRWIMYYHQLIPEPMQQLVQSEPTSKTVLKYQEVVDCFRTLFKSCNVRLLKELVVVLGAAPHMPKHIYRIPLRFCDEHAGSIDTGCGENCGELRDRDVRRVARALQGFWNEAPTKLDSNTKVFIFARVSEKLLNAGETDNMEEADDFELPHDDDDEGGEGVRRRVHQSEIDVRYCRLLRAEQEGAAAATVPQEGFWLRMTPFIAAHS